MARSEETNPRRRRNSESLLGHRQRLKTSVSLDRESFEYRWANDDLNRIHQLTVDDDWEVVNDRDAGNSASLGAQISTLAGTGNAGNPMNAVLLRKPKYLADEDAAETQRKIDALERGITDLKEGQYDTGQTRIVNGARR